MNVLTATSGKCETCGYLFYSDIAKKCDSPDVTRFCCPKCADEACPENERILKAALDAAEQRERGAVEWVSVKDRLPEYFGFYLATVAGLDELLVMPVWFDRVDQCFKTADRHNEDPGKVIAWMRLPEPCTAED
jgi:hypothetical protein